MRLMQYYGLLRGAAAPCEVTDGSGEPTWHAAGCRGAPRASFISGHGLGGRQALAEHGTRGKVKNEARRSDEIRE